jgi:hypothetical protein
MAGSVIDSPFTSYSDTAPQRKAITDVIKMIDPTDSPLIERLGGLDGAAGKFRFTAWPSTNPQWLTDNMPGLTATLQVATIASNATSATVSDASIFQPGHIIQMDAQLFWVSAISGEVLTFASLGGTAADHATGVTVEIVGIARLEGDDSDALAMVGRSTASNYTQIFHQEVKASRTQAHLAQWGISNEFDYQAAKVVPNLMRLMEKHILRNSVISAGSATAPRVMGGIPAYNTGNTTTGTTLTKTMFENAVKLAYQDGGAGPWVAPLSPANLQKVQGFYENSSYLRIDRSETTIGMPAPVKILTPFGEVEPLLDRWALDATIEIIDPQHAGLITFDPFIQEPLAKDGDAIKGQVVGEFSFCMRIPDAHTRLTAVS